jgi:hypothetical protein
MLLLDEVADDAHLTPGQIVEERVRSVNYDVLVCPGCQHSRISANRRWFSGKHACPACNYRTASESSFTLIEASYSHGGQIRITETCAHCPHRSTTIRHTAQRIPAVVVIVLLVVARLVVVVVPLVVVVVVPLVVVVVALVVGRAVERRRRRLELVTRRDLSSRPG